MSVASRSLLPTCAGEQLQTQSLHALPDAVATCEFMISSLAFDETQERLRLPLVFGTQQCIADHAATWHVLVSKQAFWFGWPARTLSTEVVRSVIPLTSTSAECLYDGLFDVRASQPFAAVEVAAERFSKLLICHHDCDGASSNHRSSEPARTSARARSQRGGKSVPRWPQVLQVQLRRPHGQCSFQESSAPFTGHSDSSEKCNVHDSGACTCATTNCSRRS